jgi:DNA adenine methylase
MTPRPFLKWAGGKAQLLPAIAARLPARFGDYHEPFIGGGALFFYLRREGRIRRATLCDANERLIRTYRGIRDDLPSVAYHLRVHGLGHQADAPTYFAEMRGRHVDGWTDAEVAAWFLYINRAGFNGLYRVNRAGRCNTPFGKVDRVAFDLDNLRACSAALQGVDLRIEDFGGVRRARPGDLVYLDPPYIPATRTASFVGYTPDGFGLDEHTRLRDTARALKLRGVHVLLSNADGPVVRDLYADGFTVGAVPARRAINSDPTKRGAVGEVLVS